MNEPAERAEGASGEPVDVDLLAAALRADSVDLDTYTRVLTTSLSDALPAGMVTVTRDRTMRDRVANRPGRVSVLRVAVGDVVLELHAGAAVAPVARVARAVRGVVISSREVGVDEWVQLLAGELAARGRQSAAASAALSRLLGAG